MKVSYLIVALLIVIIVMMAQQRGEKQQDKTSKPITYWHPGHLMSYYYPFDVPRVFRRHHRFHGRRFRHH